MTSAEGSSIRSHRRSPCEAERGNAWWLWCHASPKRGQGQPCDVGRVVVGLEPAGAEEVADRVHAPRDVVHEEDADEPAPEQAAGGARERSGDGPAGQRGQGQAEQHQHREAAVDEPHARILVEVLRVAASAGLSLSREQPARVCVPEAAHHTGRAVTVTDVRAVRIALLVSVRVMLAVVGDPAHDGSLHGHRAEDREDVLEGLRDLKRAMGEKAVEADGHADRGQHIHHGQDRERGCRHGAVPQQHDRGDEGDEGQKYGGDVDTLLQLGHDIKCSRLRRIYVR